MKDTLEINIKGKAGQGKTTLAVVIANFLHKNGISSRLENEDTDKLYLIEKVQNEKKCFDFLKDKNIVITQTQMPREVRMTGKPVLFKG